MNRNVNVSRVDLLAKLRVGRAQHASDYDVAKREYQEAAVKFLGDALKRAKKGDLRDITFNLSRPSSYLPEYDRIIAMMQASVDEVVTLSSGEFNQYWLGEWAWKGSFEAASAMVGGYLKSGKLGGL